MKNKKHIIIFSHGFGTKKDDRGLFAGENGISEVLKDTENVLFNYNKVNKENGVITISPLSKQIKILEEKINEAKSKDATIDIIAHSQGCLPVAILSPSGI